MDSAQSSSEQQASVKADDLGRVYEIGFNAGIWTTIQQKELVHVGQAYYQHVFQSIHFSSLVDRLTVQYDIVNSDEKQLLADWMTDFFRKGWLDGRSFFDSYLKAARWKANYLTIRYFQANFVDANSFGVYGNGNARQNETYSTFLSFLGSWSAEHIEQYVGRYKRKGEFLNADTLLFLEYKLPSQEPSYRIISVDESIFSLRSMADLHDIYRIGEIRRRFRKEVYDLRQKGFFSRLDIDTGHEKFEYPESMRRYFIAFKRSDKESAKMIQAGSYAYSFYQFLTKEAYLLAPESSRVLIHVAGWSNQGKSIMAIEPQNLSILQTHHTIYTEEEKEQSIAEARKRVLLTIRRNTAKSFGNNGRKFIDGLEETAATVVAERTIGTSSIQEYSHDEEITDFMGTASTLDRKSLDALGLSDQPAPLSVQNTHAALIYQALQDPKKNYLFLTGSPGIGKTTAVSNYLLDACADEGFLFIYVSPRKQVNLDIIKKFQYSDGPSKGLLRDERLITLNSNSTLIEEHEQYPTVEYHSNLIQGEQRWQSVTFVNAKDRASAHSYTRRKKREHFRRTSDEKLRAKAGGATGVLYSLCKGVYAILDQPVEHHPPRCIVATASIQALKKVSGHEGARDTLEHFREIFKHLYNERDGMICEENMHNFRKRVRHIVFMIDEVTGDESGVEFLSRIGELLRDYGFMNQAYGFTTKIIVADASLIGAEVIEQHVKSRQVEPDKIFFMRTSEDKNSPVTIQPLSYLTKEDAILINVNSYPAGQLWFHYHIALGCPPLPGKNQEKENKTQLPGIKGLVNHQQHHLEEQICTLLKKTTYEQIIVYIQNKRRLRALIGSINRRLTQEQQLPEGIYAFQHGRDYLIIHADITDEQQQRIQDPPESIRVIFMTSSASRGLSFPKVRHIIVDIPWFSIAKNLMEIVQVVYRSRGDQQIDQERKDITFYITGPIYPSETESADVAIQKCILDLLNMLLLLKLSLLTRIKGYGRMGTDLVRMIPLGGKSVSTVSDTFGECLTELLQAFASERQYKGDDELLATVHTTLKKLLRSSEMQIYSQLQTKGEKALLSSPAMQQLSTRSFYKRIERGLDSLKDLRLEPIDVDGELLIVSLGDAVIYETYPFRMAHEIKTYANRELIQQMERIKGSRHTYTERLRMALREVLELIEKIEEQQVKKSQFVEQKSKSADRYCAVPHLIFTGQEILKQYFEQYHYSTELTPEEELGEWSFKGLLDDMLRQLYPVSNVLPVAANFESFPYAVFRSYGFQEARQKLFTDRYLLASTEFNVLNMILSKE